MKMYLAHPFDDREWIREWELRMEEKFDVELVNPFYDVSRADIVNIDAGRQDRYKVDPRGIVEGDVGLILSSDGVVAFKTDKYSIGTIMEMVYARMLGKRVYLVCMDGHGEHPWLKYHSHVVVSDVERLEAYMVDNFTWMPF